MRFLTAGESHGPVLTAILEGVPAGLELIAETDIDPWLARRQGGYGRGRRMKIEQDRAQIQSGVRAGRTTGAPITLSIANNDYENWREIMSPLPGGEPRKRLVNAPRPGHADLAGGQKYNQSDLRDILERASARETAARVAVGAVAIKLLAALGIEGAGYVVGLGGIWSQQEFSWQNLSALDQSQLRCPDPEAEALMVQEIDRAASERDSLGGIIEARFRGLVPGLGSHVQWDRKLDGQLLQAAGSIPAVKGAEIGPAFDNAMRRGSEVHDPIYWSEQQGYYRESNRAGGLEGGMTTGEELVIRAALKPISTLMRPLATVEIGSHLAREAAVERSDTAAVAAASVILQSVVALVLAQAYLEQFGSDTLGDLKARVVAYQARLKAY